MSVLAAVLFFRSLNSEHERGEGIVPTNFPEVRVLEVSCALDYRYTRMIFLSEKSPSKQTLDPGATTLWFP